MIRISPRIWILAVTIATSSSVHAQVRVGVYPFARATILHQSLQSFADAIEAVGKHRVEITSARDYPAYSQKIRSQYYDLAWVPANWATEIITEGKYELVARMPLMNVTYVLTKAGPRDKERSGGVIVIGAPNERSDASVIATKHLSESVPEHENKKVVWLRYRYHSSCYQALQTEVVDFCVTTNYVYSLTEQLTQYTASDFVIQAQLPDYPGVTLIRRKTASLDSGRLWEILEHGKKQLQQSASSLSSGNYGRLLPAVIGDYAIFSE